MAANSKTKSSGGPNRKAENIETRCEPRGVHGAEAGRAWATFDKQDDGSDGGPR